MSNKQFKNQQGIWEVYTETTIDAPPAKVWQVLTDFEKIGEWSPSLKAVRGEFADGAKVDCDYFWNGRLNKIAHTLIVEEGVLFGWSDRFLPMAKDNHIFKLAPIDDGKRTKFMQTDEITGFVGRLIGKSFTRQMLESYADFNQKLKERVESG